MAVHRSVVGMVKQYSDEEIAIIKRKLGIPYGAKLPKCPAKSRKFIRRREALGDYSHSSQNHWCPECACPFTAGRGTDHLGYGWCWAHENTNARKRLSENFKMKHLEAIQQRHPSLYHNSDRFFDAVENEGQKASQTQTLEAEIKLLRATTLEMLSKIREGTATAGKDRDGNDIILADKGKVDMIKTLTETIGKLVKIDSDIHSGNVITLDSFKVWMAAFARAVKEQFPTKDEQLKFVEASKKAGEPKRG